MDCHLFSLLIQKYHDGELEPAEKARFESHLAECADCAALEASYRDVFEALEDIGYETPPAEFNEIVMARVDTGRYGKNRARKFVTAISWKWAALPGYARVSGALAAVFAVFMYIFRPIFHVMVTALQDFLALLGSAAILMGETGKIFDTVVNYFKSDPDFIVAARILLRKIHQVGREIPEAYMIGALVLAFIIMYLVARMSRSSWRKGDRNVGSV